MSKINYIGSFPNGELPILLKNKPEKKLLVGYDTEYIRKNKNNNTCISYQIVIYSLYDGKIYKVIYYPNYKNDQRLTLKDLLILIFKTANIDNKDIDGYYVNIIGHFLGVDIAMLQDRDIVLKKCEYLYKTAITFKPIKVTMQINNKTTSKITLNFSDTILLLPPSHRSLEKAISLIGNKYNKIPLSNEVKSNMLKLLIDDKSKFEEYAINDSEITLRLYVKLQYLLNSINGTNDKRYVTIGSATVNHFMQYITIPTGTDSSSELKKNKNIFYNKQFNKSNTIYQKGLNLAKRAYMGGLNNSYIVGEVESELILDIDFSSAYPTVMGLLEYSDFGNSLPKISTTKNNDTFTMELNND